MKVIQTVLAFIPKAIQVLSFLIVLAEVEGDPGTGPDKQARVLAKFKELVPVTVAPEFLRPFYDTLSTLLVNALVALFNKSGFFVPSATPSTTEP